MTIDKYRYIVDAMFEETEEVVKNPSRYSDPAEYSKFKALNELEGIRTEFVKFQENIKPYVLSEYFVAQLEEFARYAVSINNMIEDSIREEELSPAYKEKYSFVKKLRAQILSSVYKHYDALEEAEEEVEDHD